MNCVKKNTTYNFNPILTTCPGLDLLIIVAQHHNPHAIEINNGAKV